MPFKKHLQLLLGNDCPDTWSVDRVRYSQNEAVARLQQGCAALSVFIDRFQSRDKQATELALRALPALPANQQYLCFSGAAARPALRQTAGSEPFPRPQAGDIVWSYFTLY